jgi:hypothetical protein
MEYTCSGARTEAEEEDMIEVLEGEFACEDVLAVGWMGKDVEVVVEEALVCM